MRRVFTYYAATYGLIWAFYQFALIPFTRFYTDRRWPSFALGWSVGLTACCALCVAAIMYCIFARIGPTRQVASDAPRWLRVTREIGLVLLAATLTALGLVFFVYASVEDSAWSILDIIIHFIPSLAIVFVLATPIAAHSIDELRYSRLVQGLAPASRTTCPECGGVQGQALQRARVGAQCRIALAVLCFFFFAVWMSIYLRSGMRFPIANSQVNLGRLGDAPSLVQSAATDATAQQIKTFLDAADVEQGDVYVSVTVPSASTTAHYKFGWPFPFVSLDELTFPPNDARMGVWHDHVSLDFDGVLRFTRQSSRAGDVLVSTFGFSAGAFAFDLCLPIGLGALIGLGLSLPRRVRLARRIARAECLVCRYPLPAIAEAHKGGLQV